MCGNKCSCKPKIVAKCGCSTVTTVCNKPKCSPCKPHCNCASCKPAHSCSHKCGPTVFVASPKTNTYYCSYTAGCTCGHCKPSHCSSMWDSRDKCSSISCVLDSEILAGSSKEKYIKQYNLDLIDYKCGCGAKTKHSCKCH